MSHELRAELISVASYLPPTVRTSAQLEDLVFANSPGVEIQRGLIEAATGVRERRIAEPGTNASDLAVDASIAALERAGMDVTDLDLIIFASASLDVVEPATGNIVQEKLQASCPVFDIKNACNSFLNALQVADALIVAGQYNNILIAVGETPSRGTKLAVIDREDFRRSFIGFALGDAGAAAVVVPSSHPSVRHYSFKTVGQYWDAAAVLGGGSMFGYSEKHAYFQGDANRLQMAFKEHGPALLNQALHATNTTVEDYKKILVHQVSQSVLETTAAFAGLPMARIESTLPTYGNLVSASLPVAYDAALSRGDLQSGDLVMWIGLAAGVSMAVMITEV